MEAPIGEPNPPLQYPGPVRILVQTVTNLVPGNDYGQRVGYIRNIICQYHWNRDFDASKDRWNSYGDNFGYENRNCYFLIDHGESTEDPPILWYKWTGKSLIAVQQTLPEEIQSMLEKYPFTRPPVQRSRKPTPGRYDAKTYRQIIRSNLRRDAIITDDCIQFLATHPEDATWLKDNIEARFWSKVQPVLESRQAKGPVRADPERRLANPSTPEP
ncbi:uncharacterized protein Triagg1_2355 [Trichoderma aggressivum f. europaeum]|uniref:Uncharacterized protein n=1 Tax=Trichoderma aggressivum f. europaeum TaxID=173218 RepID=A0AAE1M206_9HYPO|nr:hypothetical protein Triagg1_2355 [Trichoderma aggressivum f. europaeum]